MSNDNELLLDKGKQNREKMKKIIIPLIAIISGIILAFFYIILMFRFEIIKLSLSVLSISIVDGLWLVPYAFITFPASILLLIRKDLRNKIVGCSLILIAILIPTLIYYYDQKEIKEEEAEMRRSIGVEEKRIKEYKTEIIRVFQQSIDDVSEDSIHVLGLPPSFYYASCDKTLIRVGDDSQNTWYKYDGKNKKITRLYNEKELIDKLKIYFPNNSEIINIQEEVYGDPDFMEIYFTLGGKNYTARMGLNSYNEYQILSESDPNCGNFTPTTIIIKEPFFKEINIP